MDQPEEMEPMMMGMADDQKTERKTLGKTTLTEGDIEYNILVKRDIKYSCCFQTNLILTAIISGLLQGYQIGIIAGTELCFGDEYAGVDIGDIHDEKPTTQEREFFVSFYALGAGLGAFFGGMVADWIGRKWATFLGDGVIGAGFIIVFMCSDIFGGFFGRFISGIGQGIISFSIPLYLNEVGTNKYNKIIGALFTLSTGAGMILGLNLATPFRHHWKVLYQFGLIPVIGLAVFTLILPESQAYLLNNDDDEGALEVIKRGLDDEDAEWELKKLKYEARFVKSDKITYCSKCEDIFTTYFKPFSIALGLAAFGQLVGTSSFLYYGPEIFEMTQSDVPGAEDKEQSADLLSNFIICAFVLGNLISAFMIYKLGRRMIVTIGLSVAIVTALILSFTMKEANYGDEDEGDEDVKQEYRHFDRMVFYAFIVVYMLAISIGLSTTIWSITSEILPSYLLAQASSYVATFGWLLNFGVNSIFLNILDDENGRWVLFIVLAAIGLLALGFVLLFVPETVGKSIKENLEQILGEDKVREKRSQLRREYGIKDVDVNTKSETIKEDIDFKKEPYKLQQQY